MCDDHHDYYWVCNQDYCQLWRLLSDDGRYTDHEMDTSECSSETRGVYCDQVIAGLLGEMSEDRKFFVRKVCQFLCLPH